MELSPRTEGAESCTDAEPDMAKRKPENEGLIENYLARLGRAGQDRIAFNAELAAMQADRSLAAADLQAIAVRYARGGKRPVSRAAALSSIAVRFAEIVSFHAKNAIAARVRPL